MKFKMSYVWKIVVFVVLMGLGSAAQVFALGSGLQEYRELDATSYVEPNTEEQVDATFEVEPTFEQVDVTFEVEPTFKEQVDATFEVEPTLPPLTVDAVTSREVTLSATVREPSGAAGTVDFTFEVEEPLDALDHLAGDDLSVFPATFPGQMGTIDKEDSSIPEPSMMLLVGLGVLGMIIVRKLRQRSFL